MSPRAADPTACHRRRLLVALNADDELPREVVMRLARDLERWLPPAGIAAAAAAVGVRRRWIERALEVGRRAEEIHRFEAERARAAGTALVARGEAGYPPALDDLELPPAVLYVRGAISLAAPAVAIVGSRQADVYGLEVAERFAADLAAAGLTVVSGFAVGVDGAAHRGALAAGGVTLAVLGCGVDVDYPKSHRRLRRAVAERGALLSELRMGTAPEARHFPVRNRLIAALAVGTLVVRAAPRSGSLITARLALDLGRPVWAVPGNISDRRSIGVNSLIRDGAHPVQDASEILEGLPVAVQNRLTPPEAAAPQKGATAPALGGAEREVLSRVPFDEPVAQDRLIEATGMPAERVVAALLTLELAGRLRRYPGPSYCRRGSKLETLC